ncbi:hypothetical protein ACFQ0M_07855 [Kitasatospora aburaviensis]
MLLELLHERGHPALGATFAAAVMALGPAARPLALRRAAMRVTKSCGPVVNPLNAEERLTQLHYALRPLTECIGEQLRGLAGPGPVDGAAARAAALLEVADGIDTLAHVYACLPVADAVRPAQVDRVELLWLAWLATDGMDISNLPGPNILDVLVPLLPARKPQAAPGWAGPRGGRSDEAAVWCPDQGRGPAGGGSRDADLPQPRPGWRGVLGPDSRPPRSTWE